MEKLTEYNNQLMGAPAGVLVLLGVVAIGYALKAIHWFPNKAIPAVLMLIGTGLWMLIAPPLAAGENLRTWWGRNLLLGLIVSCAAWMAHRIILKRIEKKIGLFSNGFETGEFRDPPSSNPPPSAGT